MAPARFVVLAALPRTPNGKLDRKRLPAPEAADVAGGERASGQAPQSATERALAAIWRDVLRLPQVGRDDNFFELGGDSLVAVQVLARVREQLEVSLSLQQIFAAPTIERLAAIVEAALWARRGPPPVIEGEREEGEL
jgi:acyl carrier protein